MILQARIHGVPAADLYTAIENLRRIPVFRAVHFVSQTAIFLYLRLVNSKHGLYFRVKCICRML